MTTTVRRARTTIHWTRRAARRTARRTARLLVDVWDRRGGERVTASVSVASLGGGKAVASGTSKDGTDDTNNILALAVEKGGKYKVTIRRDKTVVEAELQLGDQDGPRVDVFLAEKEVSLRGSKKGSSR